MPKEIIKSIFGSYVNLFNALTEDKIRGIVKSDRFDMGYGWTNEINLLGSGYNQIAHTGNTGASSAFCGYDPNNNIGIVFLSNINRFDRESADLLFLALKEDVKVHIPMKSSSSHINLVGTYQSIGNISTMKISIKDNNLHLEGLIPDIIGLNKISGKIKPYPFETIQDIQKNSFFLDSVQFGLRTKVLFEFLVEKIFLTIGINKFRKIS